MRITLNGRAYEVTVEELGPELAAAPTGTPVSAAVPEPSPVAAPPAAAPPAAAGGGTAVLAPLPGVVTEVRVAPGQAVAAGEVVVVLEAMKMDNDILAPRAGTVRDVRVDRGDQVASRQVLVVLE